MDIFLVSGGGLFRSLDLMEFLIVGRVMLSISHAEENKFSGLKEFCEWEDFEAACPPDKVIVIKDAIFGRMQHGRRCIKRDYGYVGCYTNVRHLADKRCSGKQSCKISVPDRLFADTVVPCPDDLKAYLMADYKCVKVMTPRLGKCNTMDAEDPGLRVSGLLSSSIKSGCGQPQSPWIIQVPSGQRVNLTLIDFTDPSSSRAASNNNTGSRHSNRKTSISPASPACQVLVVIKETNPLSTATICGGQETNELSERSIYLSISNQVELRTMMGATRQSTHNEKDMGQYLIRYETVGCPDMLPPVGGWFKRESSEKASVGCDNFRKVFYIKCQDNNWSNDHIINCTAGVMSSVQSLTSLNEAAALITVVGIAVLVGLLMLITGLCIIKRKRIPWCKGSTSTPDSRSRNTAQGNYFPQPAGRLPDYFSVAGLPPYSGGIQRKDSFTALSDGNDYAYVEDVQSQIHTSQTGGYNKINPSVKIGEGRVVVRQNSQPGNEMKVGAPVIPLTPQIRNQVGFTCSQLANQQDDAISPRTGVQGNPLQQQQHYYTSNEPCHYGALQC